MIKSSWWNLIVEKMRNVCSIILWMGSCRVDRTSVCFPHSCDSVRLKFWLQKINRTAIVKTHKLRHSSIFISCANKKYVIRVAFFTCFTCFFSTHFTASDIYFFKKVIIKCKNLIWDQIFHHIQTCKISAFLQQVSDIMRPWDTEQLGASYSCFLCCYSAL